MNTSDPPLSSSTKSESSSWLPIDFFTAGLWLAIPIGLFIGGQQLRHVMEEFAGELPAHTEYLISPYSPIPFTIVSFAVFLAMLCIPDRKARRRFVWLACIIGGLIGVVCLASILVPLVRLRQELG